MILSLALSSILGLGSAALAQEPPRAAFQGESCKACHAAIRDAVRPAERAPAEFAGDYDAVVVGGGLSGLTAAHYLKGLNVVVLEKEDRPGGRTRRERFSRWSYSVGAVYCAKPYGIIADLYKELGIFPLKFKDPIHLYWTPKGNVREWITDEGIGRLAKNPAEKKALKALIAAFKDFDSKESLTIPIQESDPKVLARYDHETFADYLLKNFGQRALELGDHYARDVFGAGARDVSAAAGIMYMGSEVSDSYGWPGGLGEVAEALTRDLGPVVRTGSLVEEVVPSSDTVRVFYRREGKRYELRAKSVVLAIPSMIARRIVNGLSPKKERALAKVRYSSYAVLAMQFKKPILEQAFVLWTPGLAFSDLSFVGGERLEGGASGASGQEVSAYLPLGSSDGRRWLLETSDEQIKKSVLADMDKVLPGSSRELEESNVVRWGHAMPILAPGYFTEVQPGVRAPDGRLFFAGVDSQAPAIEGAMYSGYQAAQEARKYLGK